MELMERPYFRGLGNAAVCVPETFCPLNDEQEEQLLCTLYPSARSNNYGIDLHLSTQPNVLLWK